MRWSSGLSRSRNSSVKLIQSANTRKAISPTQFNHQSTRGHCILIMEVETTNEKNEKQKGCLKAVKIKKTKKKKRENKDVEIKTAKIKAAVF